MNLSTHIATLTTAATASGLFETVSPVPLPEFASSGLPAFCVDDVDVTPDAIANDIYGGSFDVPAWLFVEVTTDADRQPLFAAAAAALDTLADGFFTQLFAAAEAQELRAVRMRRMAYTIGRHRTLALQVTFRAAFQGDYT